MHTGTRHSAAARRAVRWLNERLRVATERRALTPREAQIVALAARGLTNRQIAERLGISRYTVADRLRFVFLKTELKSRKEIAFCLNEGIILRKGRLTTGCTRPIRFLSVRC